MYSFDNLFFDQSIWCRILRYIPPEEHAYPTPNDSQSPCTSLKAGNFPAANAVQADCETVYPADTRCNDNGTITSKVQADCERVYSADTWRDDNVIITSKRPCDVVLA